VCLENVEQFLLDAELLKKNKSFGHAYSLAVLGFEELAKFWMAFYLFTGVYKETDEELDFFQKDHIYKQFTSWEVLAYLLMLAWIDETRYQDEIKQLVEQLQKGIISNKAYERKLRKLLQKESNELEIAKRILEIEEVIKQLNMNPEIMDNKKQRGFYVGFDLRNKKIEYTPSSFIEEDIILIETLRAHFEYSRELFLTIKNNLNRKATREDLENIRSLTRLLREKISEFERNHEKE